MVCGLSSVISMVFHSGRVFRAAPGHWSGNTECRSRYTPFRWISRFTVMLRHRFTKSLSVYTDWAMTANGPAALFDPGGGGRAIATDCHDASDSTGGLVASNPHCWVGGRDELEALRRCRACAGRNDSSVKRPAAISRRGALTVFRVKAVIHLRNRFGDLFDAAVLLYAGGSDLAGRSF